MTRGGGRRTVTAGLAALALTACGEQNGERAPADPGRQAFAPCAACHTTGAPGTREASMRLVGPNLWGVYGQPAARLSDFAYSPALKNSGLVWDDETLSAFLENPPKVVRGNRMSYPGEPDAARRAAIVEYLKTLK